MFTTSSFKSAGFWRLTFIVVLSENGLGEFWETFISGIDCFVFLMPTISSLETFAQHIKSCMGG